MLAVIILGLEMIDGDDYAMAKSQCSMWDCESWSWSPRSGVGLCDSRPATLGPQSWALNPDLDPDLELPRCH